MKIIFLDIDGVLNHQHFGKDDSSKFGLDSECVDALRSILIRVPDAKIVVTSAWKYTKYEANVSSTVEWRHVLENMLGRPGVIIADAPCFDGRSRDDGKPGYYNRADDILHFMGSYPDIESFVVLDDEISPYIDTSLAKNVVDCDIRTGRGLDMDGANLAVRLLLGESRTEPMQAQPSRPAQDAEPAAVPQNEEQPAAVSQNEEQPADPACYPVTRTELDKIKEELEKVNAEYNRAKADAAKMAGTLVWIDRLLHVAAASDKPETVMPMMCMAMYGCGVNFADYALS